MLVQERLVLSESKSNVYHICCRHCVKQYSLFFVGVYLQAFPNGGSFHVLQAFFGNLGIVVKVVYIPGVPESFASQAFDDLVFYEQVDVVVLVDDTWVGNVVVADVRFQTFQLGERLELVDTFSDVNRLVRVYFQHDDVAVFVPKVLSFSNLWRRVAFPGNKDARYN